MTGLRVAPRDGAGAGGSGSAVGFLVRAYLFLVGLVVATHLAPTLPMLGLLPLTLLLSAPAMLGLWHRAVIRSLLALHQFSEGRGLHWVGSRRVLGYFLGAGFAIGVAFMAILHAAFFGMRDWALLAAMPIVFVLARFAAERWLVPQFAGAAYASRGTILFAEVCVVALYLAGWVALGVAAPEVPAAGLLERVAALQAPWIEAPSAMARWLAQASAWADAGIASASVLGEGGGWRVVVAVMMAPVATIVFVALGFRGLALPDREVRRVFGPVPSAADEPPAVPPSSAAVWAAVIVVSLLVLISAVASLEQWVSSTSSPLALERLTKCEAIDGKAYKLGTFALVKQALVAGTVASEEARAASCQALDKAKVAAEKGVDAYLDWYYSLTAEWMRIGRMLTGDLETMLADRLSAELSAAPGWAQALTAAQVGGEDQVLALGSLHEKLKGILRDNVLLLDESSCKVVRRESIAAVLQVQEANIVRLRAASSAGVGLAAGAVASKVAAKAMTKASMKTAAKLLAKFAAKRATAAGVSMAAGAALGSFVPGVGTAVGAVVGGVVGVGVSVGIDFLALEAEEHFDRPSFKKELMESVTETLAPPRQAFSCGP